PARGSSRHALEDRVTCARWPRTVRRTRATGPVRPCSRHARSFASPVRRRTHLEVHRGSLGRRDPSPAWVHGQGGRINADARPGRVSRRLSHAGGGTTITTKEPGDINNGGRILVRLVGTRRPIAPLGDERFARVRTAVHGAWRDEYGVPETRQTKTRRRWLMVAVPIVAAAGAIAFAIWGSTRTAGPVRTPAPVLTARIEYATGSPAAFTAGDAVMAGSTVKTTVGTLAMTLTSGVQLRLNTASTARVDSPTDVALERGAVYVDSTGAHPARRSASPISIHTPAGIVRDIGTQFEVRIEVRQGGPAMRIRVRAGQVRVTYANGVEARAGAGEELFSSPDGSDRSINRRP